MKIECFEHLSNANTADIQRVWALLCEYDNAFVPPLSCRKSTLEQSFEKNDRSAELPTEYFEHIKKQKILLCRENGGVIGFMSFLGGYIDDRLSDITEQAVYVSTVIVDKRHRGQRITERFYEYLETFTKENGPEKLLMTRTWKGNDSHIHILYKMGFSVCKVIENDRGEGVDTLYFIKNI